MRKYSAYLRRLSVAGWLGERMQYSAYLFALCLLAALPASAQEPPQAPQAPMMGGAGGMPDPSAMSGIPRPDPSVPAGQLVVRVIRGDFAHAMPGRTVRLAGPDGERTALVDGGGHARFDGLKPGSTVRVSCAADGKELKSQDVPVPADSGVKLMLVFPRDEQAQLREHDGVARTDAALPANAVVVSVVDEANRPRVGVQVVLAHADGGKVDGDKARTDEQGEARFTVPSGVGAKAPFMAAVKEAGLSAMSQPFSVSSSAVKDAKPAGGWRVGLRALRATNDAAQLSLGQKSHLVLEVKDESVNVTENLVVENRGSEPYDPGPGGLVLPLPAGAKGAVVATEGTSQGGALAIEGDQAVWHGLVPPGETPLSFAFVMMQQDHGVELRQKLSLAMEQPVAVTDRYDGMRVCGGDAVCEQGVALVPRELSGRPFWVIHFLPQPAGGELALRLLDLPHRSHLQRDVAMALAVLLVLWGVVAAWRGGRGDGKATDAERARLVGQRDALLAELATLDAAAAGAQGGSSGARRRGEVRERLAWIYRRLDEVDAA